MLSPTDLAKKVGKRVLFIGTETVNWTLADFSKAAKNARALGFDTISPKRADGGNKWYQNAAHMGQERQACLTEGCGYLPFMYSYGPKFGNGQIDLEVAVAKEMASVCDGLVCMDLEVEWNGQVGAAQYLAGKMRSFPGDVILSTWADPVQQNWTGVIQALNPVVSAWGPQEYTNWLALQEGQLAADGVNLSKLFPEIDVADTFGGANNALGVMHSVVGKGHLSVWVWEYMAAVNNPTLIHAMLELMGPPTVAPPKPVTPPIAPPPKPPVPPLPAPTHGTGQVFKYYSIVDGDSLTGIAAKLGLTNWFQDLFLPNKAYLDAIAQTHGQPNSNGGNLLFVPSTLKYLKAAK